MLQFFALNCSDENAQQVLLGFASNFASFSQLEYTPLDILDMFPSVQLYGAEAGISSPFSRYRGMVNFKERNLAVFLGLLKPMRARHYSISNSPIVTPSSVRIVYKVVEYVGKGGQEKRGLCSTWLKSRKSGDAVAIFLSKSKFRLPQKDDAPIIMVGAGTGISPYFGFLEHRQTIQKQRLLSQEAVGFGQAVLIHGCRSEADFPHREILDGALTDGVLNHCGRRILGKRVSNLHTFNTS